MMDKSSLRKLYLEKRSFFAPAELEEMSARIALNFATLSFHSVQYLHTFYPIVGKFEVDSLKIAEWLRVNHPEIKLVLSKTDFTTHQLLNYLWEENTPLAMNSRGITEPEGGQLIDPQLLDVILIPLLVFDKYGNRVGYGKGFYDRFLKQCRPDAQKIGLSFFSPVEKIAGIEIHDIPLNSCITPEKVWWF